MQRALVTLGSVLAVLSLQWVPVPGFDPILHGLAPESLNLGALGLGPLASAFITVELAALIVPRWRQLRLARQGRARLNRAALTLSVFLAIVQALGMGQWLMTLNEPGIIEVSYAQVLLFAASLTGAVVLTTLLGRVVTERGLGSGWSVLLGAIAAFNLVQSLIVDARARPDQLLHTLGGSGLIVCAWAGVFLGYREITRVFGSLNPLPQTPEDRGRDHDRGSLLLLLPASGAFPLAILLTWTTNPLLVPIESPWLHAVVVAGTALLLGWCFQRPRRVAEAAAQLKLEGDAYSLDNLRSSVRRAAVASAAILVAFALGMHWLHLVNHLGYEVLEWGIVVAVALDLAREWRVTGNRDFVAIADLHRVYVATLVSEQLRKADIPFVLRGLHHRTLGQVAAPYVPMTVLVERSRAAEALELVGEIC